MSRQVRRDKVSVPALALHTILKKVKMENNQSPEGSDTSQAISPFESLGISVESVEKFLGDRDRYDQSKYVCICGHAINKHSGYETGYGVCLTGRHYCPCRQKQPVLYANDTRYFMRKTFGLGSKHALSAGLLRLAQEGKKAHWLETPKCWSNNCQSGNPLIFPVPLDLKNQIVNKPGPINVLMCETCILNMKGAPGNEGKGWVW
jgi:hypothetical protein